jgi:coiled-coil domain-containing protein 55
MSGLKFSFNKPKATVKAPVDTSKPAFDDSEDEDNVLTKPPQTKKQPQAIVGLNEDLRVYTSLSEETAARMAKEALEVDPSVFDYDAVYDELKIAEKQKSQIAELDRQERKACPVTVLELIGSQSTWTG